MRGWEQRWKTIMLLSGAHAAFSAQEQPSSSLPPDMVCVPRRFLSRAAPPESCPSKEKHFLPVQDGQLSPFPPAS